MHPTRREMLGTLVVASGLAGCAGGSGEAEPTDEPADGSAPEPTEEPMAATVHVADHPELGEILVDADGMTLYMFDNDTRGSGESSCYDGCAEAWPPLTVEDDAAVGEGVTADLGTIARDGGAQQVVANGWPLYYFQNDAEPGDVTGQGRGGVWWVLRPDGTPVRPSPTIQVSDHPDLGEILVDADGMTLYMFDNDTRGSGASSCYDGCAEAWPPLTVDGSPVAGGDVTAGLETLERDDGAQQVVANGWPLYYFQNDAEPGDVTGQGRGDVWWVLDPAGVPRKPSGGGGSSY